MYYDTNTPCHAWCSYLQSFKIRLSCTKLVSICSLSCTPNISPSKDRLKANHGISTVKCCSSNVSAAAPLAYQWWITTDGNSSMSTIICFQHNTMNYLHLHSYISKESHTHTHTHLVTHTLIVYVAILDWLLSLVATPLSIFCWYNIISFSHRNSWSKPSIGTGLTAWTNIVAWQPITTSQV